MCIRRWTQWYAVCQFWWWKVLDNEERMNMMMNPNFSIPEHVWSVFTLAACGSLFFAMHWYKWIQRVKLFGPCALSCPCRLKWNVAFHLSSARFWNIHGSIPCWSIFTFGLAFLIHLCYTWSHHAISHVFF
jgi:hypothetical protein